LKRILCLSDTHPGSIYGMLPPNFVGSNQQPVGQNALQKYTWECWLDMIRWAGQVDAIMIVGDVVEGKQFKSHASELCLPLVSDQEQASIEVFTPLIDATKPKKLFFIKGTFYHDDEMGRSVDNVAKALKATTYEGLGVGTYAKEVLDIDIEGVPFDFSHGISVSGGLYRAVAIDREALWSAIAGKTGKAPKADVIVRGHAHYFVHVEHVTKHAVILPAWQLQTSFMRKHSRYRMIPDLGAVLFTVDSSLKAKGEDPCVLRKRIYDLPPQRVVHL
jgi:predicted phosphodiesterase